MGLFDNLFKKNAIREKSNHLRKELEINADAMVFAKRGLDNYERQNYAVAIADFTKAINAQPSNQNLYTMRGTAFENMGNDIDASKDFIKTLELHSTHFVAAYRLGMVYFRKKDIHSAVKWLKVSFNNATDQDLSPFGIGNHNIMIVHKKIIASNLGNFLTKLNQFEEGFKYLDEAIRLDPEYSNPYLVKGLAYAQMGKPAGGILLLKKAKQLGSPQAGAAIKLLEQLPEQSNQKKEDRSLELDFEFSLF
ncbi:MAG: tetratricopeptide repeat protein [Ginsengibacter sp.]